MSLCYKATEDYRNIFGDNKDKSCVFHWFKLIKKPIIVYLLSFLIITISLNEISDWTGSDFSSGIMNQTQKHKGCPKSDFENMNIKTRLGIEQSRLQLLKSTLSLKRPLQSLRVSGLNGLNERDRKRLIQDLETKATLQAIESKKRDIRIIEKQIGNLKKTPNYDKMKKDSKLLAIQKKKLQNKVEFLKEKDKTSFKDWDRKRFVADNLAQYNKIVSTRKEKKKQKCRDRKNRKKEEALVNRAKLALDKNLVINLTDLDIPLYSVAILSYGQGWIPNPTFNHSQFKLDGYNASNKSGWKAVFKNSCESDECVPNDLLKSKITAPCQNVNDNILSKAKESLDNFVENISPEKTKTNMNRYEKEGFKWLTEAVKSGLIAITLADKGGAIIIVKPEVIKNITAEKLSDTQRYANVGPNDPTPPLKEELYRLWVTAVQEGYVSLEQAKKTVGLLRCKGDTREWSISTCDKYKHGTTYGYPNFKVHKMSQSELAEKKIPPV